MWPLVSSALTLVAASLAASTKRVVQFTKVRRYEDMEQSTTSCTYYLNFVKVCCHWPEGKVALNSANALFAVISVSHLLPTIVEWQPAINEPFLEARAATPAAGS
jgi:hypothetical protein